MKPNRPIICFVLAVVGLALVHSAQAQTPFIFTEGAFVPEARTLWVEAQASGSSVASQMATGGNPGEFLTIQNTSQNDDVFAFVFFNDAIYDPRARGPIQAVSGAFDHQRIGIWGQGVAIAIRQNGTNYFARSFDQSFPASWKSLSWSGLKAEDFRTPADVAAHPDFSTSAPALQFGLVNGNGGGFGVRTTLSGFDNFAVAVVTGLATNLVWIPPGTFTMGSPPDEAGRFTSEGPQTRVTISRGFWMSKYEVTQREYTAVMQTNPSRFAGDVNRPVETVSWEDATQYCQKLTETERAAGRLPAGYGYRLPTEAEWEYACRAGTTTRFSFGDDESTLGQYAWFQSNSGYNASLGIDGGGTTFPVGSLRANDWGLHDMHGNVTEWVRDWRSNYPGGNVTDWFGPATGTSKISRGGALNSPSGSCRSASRGSGGPPDMKGYGTGFRVVLAEVDALRPPVILQQPASRSVVIGAEASFAVRAEGKEPLRYQWRKDGLEIPGATNAVLVIGQPTPMARWSFEGDARDGIGALHASLKGGATVANGRLILNGTTAYADSSPLVESLSEKTLEAWTTLNSVDRHQDILSIETITGSFLTAVFDGIVFGEHEAGHWTAGSDYGRRKRSFNGPLETAGPDAMIHVALVYAADGRIKFYRNGTAYGTSYIPQGDQASLRTFPSGSARVLFGQRVTGSGSGFLNGQIDEARVYAKALTDVQVANSFASGPNQLPVRSGSGVQQSDTGNYSVVVRNAQGEVVSEMVSLSIAQPDAQAAVYTNNFEGTVGAEWSLRTVSATPAGARRFLGQFGDQTVRLSLTNLPPHSVVRVSFDLFVINSWDGNNTTYGPDRWTWRVVNGPVLVDTTFSNVLPIDQAFPGDVGQGSFPAGFLASATNTLGYAGASDRFGDTVYAFSRSFTHGETNLTLQFTYNPRAGTYGGLGDEGWGLDNVRVEVLDASAGLLEAAASTLLVNESAGSAVVQINRPGGSAGTVSVNYQMVNGTALAGSDYTAQSGTLTFAAGETNQTITIPILNNTLAEPTEEFRLTLTNPTGGAVLGREAVTIMILDDDGVFEFARTNYAVTELEGWVILPLRWTGPTNQTVSVRLRALSGTATAGSDFLAYDGRVTFNPGQREQNVWVDIYDNRLPEPDETFRVELSAPSFGASLGALNTAFIIIADDDTTEREGRGASWSVTSLAVQPDAKALIGGGFLWVNGVARNRIARLNADGSLDTTFSPAEGFNNWPAVIQLQPDGKVLVGGDFTQYRATGRNRIARLNANGSLDTTFNPGAGANNRIGEMAVQPDGKILVAGNFTTINGTSRNRVARFNADGSLDNTFNPGSGAPAYVWALALQSDGKVVLSGDFTSFNGTARQRIARLNADGSVDNSFTTALNGICNDIAALPDGRLLLGGWFTTVNGVTRNRIARLNANGTLDATFNAGTGPDRSPWHLTPLNDGRYLVSGYFSAWNNQPRAGLVRLNAGGGLDATFQMKSGIAGFVETFSGDLLAMDRVKALPDGRLLGAGNFRWFEGAYRPRFVYLDADGRLGPEPAHWTQWRTEDGGNGHWYALTSGAQNWTEAEAEAVVQRGHLVSVNSAAEQAFLEQAFLRGPNRLRPLWIGLNDAAVEGQFAWSSGEPVTFTHWFSGEPNDFDSRFGSEDFVTLNWHFADDPVSPSRYGRWNDNATGGSSFVKQSDGPYFGIMETALDPRGPALVITRVPVSQTNVTGGSVTFVVEASGRLPLRYQWERNGQPLSGATNAVLTLANLSDQQAGTYRVVVTDAVESTASATAELGVVSLPAFSAVSVRRPPVDPPGQPVELQFRVAEPAGLRVVLEQSHDLVAWEIAREFMTPVETSVPVGGEPATFFRLSIP